VWLPGQVVLRAVGAFNEASSFGICSVFLALGSVAAISHPAVRRHLLPFPVLVLFSALGFAGVLFSYSRGSAIALLVSLFAFFLLRRGSLLVPVGLTSALLLGTALAYYLFPEYVQAFLEQRILFSLQNSNNPALVSNGRFDSWSEILRRFSEHPEFWVLGIGYKTLQSSPFGGLSSAVGYLVADNNYLASLVEEGILGFLAFLRLNWYILKTSYREATTAVNDAVLNFCASVLCVFWVGQMVQMFTADSFTYTRLLPLTFILLGVLSAHQASRVSGLSGLP
jgi:O-antigen ligase